MNAEFRKQELIKLFTHAIHDTDWQMPTVMTDENLARYAVDCIVSLEATLIRKNIDYNKPLFTKSGLRGED